MTTDRETRAASWLQAWDAQGTHRTGTAGDSAGAAWLTEEARALGAEVAVEEFAFDRLDPVETYLELAGERIEGVPVFDAPPTDGRGISGRLGPLSGDAEIAVVELGPRAVYSGEFERLRRRAGHRALVVICKGEAPGLALINAEQFKSPYGMPALHLPSEAGDRVLAATRDGAPARLVGHSRQVPATAVNIVATLPGHARTAPPLVVMTPRSSWWHSTAERGGGLVCWLESLRAALAARRGRDVIFTANTGHELGHLGLDDFIARRPGYERPDGAAWVHYGANIGAYGSVLSLVSNDAALRALGLSALAGTGHPPDDIPWPSAPPSGETRDIHKAGGQYLTLVGTNSLFHLPQDRWPDAVDLPAIARIAAAGAHIVAARAG